MLGSDFRYLSCAQNRELLEQSMLGAEALAAINSGNAEWLFSRSRAE